MSEIFGEKTIKADKLLRTLRFKKSSEEILANSNVKPYILKYAQAYIDGIHDFIATGNLPIEFRLLGYEPEPFEITDIMAMTGYMALTFTEGINGDIYLSELLETLPESKLNALRIGADTDLDYFKDMALICFQKGR